MGAAVGEDGGAGDVEVCEAVDLQVFVDDAGLGIVAHAGAAHGVAGVFERQGSVGEEELGEPCGLLQADAVEALTQVGREAAQGLEFVGRYAPIDEG